MGKGEEQVFKPKRKRCPAAQLLVGLWWPCCIPIPGATPPGEILQEQILQEQVLHTLHSFSLQDLGCFKKKLPRKLGSRPKLLLFYHLSYWQGKEETEQFVSQPGFAGHEKAKKLVGETIWRGRNEWRVEISPVRVWGTRTDTVQEGEQTLSRSFADPYSQLFPHFPPQQFKCCQKVKRGWFPRIVYKFRGTLSFPEISGCQKQLDWPGLS